MGQILTDTQMNILKSPEFKSKKDILSVYFTAGYPQLENTAEILRTLSFAGADVIEIGVPFSDPIADGPTIQKSNQKAIENGISLQKIIEQIEPVVPEIEIPVILMGYLNPMIQFGMDKLLKNCQRIGISGLIIPDLPMYEYELEYRKLFHDHDMVNIFLITPQTAPERIARIDELSDGFIYMVSTAGTTGARKGISEEQEEYFRRIKSLQLKNPTLIGFGISDRESFSKACEYANGAIVGSAFIDLISKSEDLEKDIEKFVKKLKSQS
jgi:tryptophan synthase alpha chain